MKSEHQIYLISDSTGETLDRIFLALKAQFINFEYELNNFSFTRTENQIQQILEKANKRENPIILYTIVNSKLAKYLADQAQSKQIPCFGVLGDLILSFSKILNQRASHEPSGQHVVSRTSKTPTSIYLANKGYKTSNIPLVNEKSIPTRITSKNFKPCIVGLITEAERLFDIRKNRLNSLKENESTEYTNLEKIKEEVENSKKIFRKNQWPTIDVTRKSVEETAASIIKIYEIKNK